jgi:hypothetical protein
MGWRIMSIIDDLLAPLTILVSIMKWWVGLMILSAIVALGFLAQFVFGVNIGSITLELVKVMVETFRNLWLWMVENFKYDNVKQIFLLSILLIVFMVVLFMAMHINQTGTSGKASIGSDTVRTGTGNESSGGIFSTTQTLPYTETTIPTPPEHCYNLSKDYDEEDIDCGGIDCMPCHCQNKERDYGENGLNCDGGCPDACSCTVNSQCGLNYCCPDDTAIPENCRGRCVTSDYSNPSQHPQTDAENFDHCVYGGCHEINPTITYPINNTEVTPNGTIIWY